MSAPSSAGGDRSLPSRLQAPPAGAVTAVCFMAICLMAGCGDAARRAAPEIPRPTRGYILISLDTLRADHLGCYGYPRDTSPFLDRLAERAVLFENAIAQYPSTLTSHMSIFTGLYPAEHGVYPPDSVLPRGIETLPEVFQRSGFRTAGFTEGGFMHGRFGFRRGFDLFQSRDRKKGEEVERTFERGLRFLREVGGDERFFLFLHTYAVHAPYEPPASYRDLFWKGEAPSGAFPPTGPRLSRHNALGETLSEPVRAYFEALYDAEIRHLDDVLARFFSALEASGLAEETTVVITSDHGEELQDHGRMNHLQLYRETTRVPLLFIHPDFDAGRRHAPPVESIDLAPTLYGLARIEPRGYLSGASLARYLSAPSGALAPGTAYTEVSGGVWSLLSAEAGGLHHLLVFQPPPRHWLTRRLELEASEPLAFEIRSYREDRVVEVWDGDDRLRALTIGPRWTPLALPAPSSGALVITAPDCTVAKEAAGEKRLRCYSFQVRGVPLGRTELYDVAVDPRESADVSSERQGVTRKLYARLGDYRSRRSAAGAEVDELDDELRSELEALGYLQ